MSYLKNNYKNLLILFLGIIILALGSSIIIKANIGADSITVFSQGLENTLNLTYGQAYILANLFFLVIVLLLHKKKLGVGTIVITFLTGFLIDVYLKYLPLRSFDNLILNFLFSFSGLVFAAFGLALYIYSNSGLGSLEAFVDYGSKKLNIHFGFAKIIFDALLFIIGALMGGKFGIMSVVSVITLGPMIDLFKYLIAKTNLIKNPKESKNAEPTNNEYLN